MAKLRLIAELGSCHMGKIEYAKEAVDRVLDAGFDAIKFQLFPNETKYTSVGNVWLPPDIYMEIADYAEDQGLHCSASVFDELSFEFLLRLQPSFIKFAYSQKERGLWIQRTLEEGIEAIVSCDVMTDQKLGAGMTKLFCVPRYPVYEVLTFDGLFPRFDGFSDHTLGYQQTLLAAQEGAKIIEKHITLNHSDITCPDSYFALRPAEFTHMAIALRKMEKTLE